MKKSKMSGKFVLKKVSKENIDNIIETLSKLKKEIGNDLVNIELREDEKGYSMAVSFDEDLYAPLSSDHFLNEDVILNKIAKIHFDSNLSRVLQYIDDNTKVIKLTIKDQDIIGRLKAAAYAADALVQLLGKDNSERLY